MENTNPRYRLISETSRLIYEKGLTNVGISEIIEAADVAKMSLYNLFGSKENLILAVLEEYMMQRRSAIYKAFDGDITANDKLFQFFQIAKATQKGECFRGCVFINAALQTSDPASKIHQVAGQHKEWIKDQIMMHLFSQRPISLAELKAQQILILWDGAISEAYIQQTPAIIDYGLIAATELISNSSMH